MRKLVAVVGLAASALVLAACSAPAPAPAPSPSAVPLRAVEPCAATVVVPAETVGVVPDAAQPASITLRVGGAVSFPVATGARVGIAGDPDSELDAGLCSAPSVPAGRAVYVAVKEGYLRLAVQTGIESPRRFFLTVNP